MPGLPLTTVAQTSPWGDMSMCDDSEDDAVGSHGPPSRSWDKHRSSSSAAAGFATPARKRSLSPPESPLPVYEHHALGAIDTEAVGTWEWQHYAGACIPSYGIPMNQCNFAYNTWVPPDMEAVEEEYDWMLRTKAEQIQKVKDRIVKAEGEMQDIDAQRRAAERQIDHMRALMEKYCIPMEELDHPSILTEVDMATTTTMDAMPAAHIVTETTQKKDDGECLRSKLARLGEMLRQPTAEKLFGKSRRSAPRASPPSAASHAIESLSGKDEKASMPVGEDMPAGGASGMGIEEQLKRLERQTNTKVDARAMRALRNLSAHDAKKAVRWVQDLVQQQGGICENLSAMLQATCHKAQKHSKRTRASQGY